LLPAVVGGLVGAGAVLIGVLLTEGFIRIRNRRDTVERAVLTLATQATASSALLKQPVPDGLTGVPTELGQVIDQAALVLVLARWPLRHHAKIREEAGDIAIQAAVAFIRWVTNGPLTQEQTLRFGTGKLHKAVFGDRPPLDDRIDAVLQAEGFGSLSDLKKEG
jgi:hypothetical protein